DLVYGIKIMLYWQVAASAVTWIASLIVTSKVTRIPVSHFILDMAPYISITIAAMAVMYIMPETHNDLTDIIARFITGATTYIGINYLLHSKIQHDAWEYISYRFCKKNINKS
ncbi:MAG: hypothetical protein K2O12_05325, partial [Muribaculaceae bacterium]|nr:hypothetical protein [Muribaculaceae bacterium]